MTLHIAEAITALRPDAHWHMVGNTLDGLVWEDEEQTAPTQEEVDAKLIELEAELEATKVANVAQKAAILERLGLTEDELRVVLS
jgi:hypothetical protein